ncbi:MAG: flagellar biosynthetic protein FliO [Deltaproteobacteria bacterium]|nr:flagellar biosynthetic protein FliO [Deltaproteobacteria bacterium]
MALRVLAALPQIALLEATTGTGDGGYGAALLRMVAALVLVCVIAYVVLRYGLRWLMPRRTSSQRMEVLEHCGLGGSKGLWIVRVGERYFLVGGAEGGLSMLTEIDKGEISAKVNARDSFAGDSSLGDASLQAFSKILRRKRGHEGNSSKVDVAEEVRLKEAEGGSEGEDAS